MTKSYDLWHNIRKFNDMYGLPNNYKPLLPSQQRLADHHSMVLEEVREIEDAHEIDPKNFSMDDPSAVDGLTELADWLADVCIYQLTFAAQHGINLFEVMQIVMESNFSKLGADGKPIYDERGKVMKGPNYRPPEAAIKDYIRKQLDGEG